MDAKKPKYYVHLDLGGDSEATLLNLYHLFKEFITFCDLNKSKFFQHNIPKDKEDKHLHRAMIYLSLIILMFFKCSAGILKKTGLAIEDYLNNKLSPRNNKRKSVGDEDFISIVGYVDTRTELNEDFKHEDARYYPALSMMASKLAYENENFIKATVTRHLKMEFVKFYNCYDVFQKRITTQAFIMREDDKIILAFRGTEGFTAYDWCTDFDYSWCQIKGIRGKVHKGFMSALGLQKCSPEHGNELLGEYTGVFPEQIEQDERFAYYAIRDTLKEIASKNEGAKFIVTGHSLGGALAILFPAVLVSHGEQDLLNRLDAVYTFGQPRVGNENFGNFMKTHLRKHNIKYYRIVYGLDIVPCVPFDDSLMAFKHFGTSIHFNSLYHGKIVEEEEARKKETRLVRYTRRIIRMIVARTIIAVWELVRGFIIGYTAGPYYKEGWLMILARVLSFFIPEFVHHNPQDYLNATLLASEDLFKYYPALY